MTVLKNRMGFLRGTLAESKSALTPIVLQKKSEANKMLVYLPKMSREITDLISEYDAFIARAGNNPDRAEIAFMVTRMTTLLSSIRESITEAKKSPYIRNLLIDIAGGRRKSKRSKSAKRKNRTRRQ